MKKREIDSILGRMRELSGTFTDVEMCEKLDISYGTLDNWKSRDNIPSKRLQKIAKENNISYDWLVFGKQVAVNGAETINESDIKYDNQISIPYHPEVYASAGGGSDATIKADTSPVTFSRDFIHSYLRVHSAAGLSIINSSGDSMAPTIRSGELMIVNEFGQEGFKDGAIYVVMCGSALLVKRIWLDPNTKEYILSSDNESVDDIRLTIDEGSDCRFVGRVVGHMDRV